MNRLLCMGNGNKIAVEKGAYTVVYEFNAFGQLVGETENAIPLTNKSVFESIEEQEDSIEHLHSIGLTHSPAILENFKRYGKYSNRLRNANNSRSETGGNDSNSVKSNGFELPNEGTVKDT